jgi:hypothetical protein
MAITICPKCNQKSLILKPLGRVEQQQFFSIKRWSEFQQTCYTKGCGYKGEVEVVKE